MVAWTAENNFKLLFMVLQNHFNGTPDYESLAKEWGSQVSTASLKIQFCKLRREGIKGGNHNAGRIGKRGKGSGRWRQRKVSEEEIDEMGCKVEETELEGK